MSLIPRAPSPDAVFYLSERARVCGWVSAGEKYANTQGAAAQSFVMGALFSFLWFGKTKFPKAEVRAIALHSSPCLHSGCCKAARFKKKKRKKMHLDERACKLWVECPLPVSWFYIKQKQDCLESRKVRRTVVRTLAIFHFMHIPPATASVLSSTMS